MADEVNPDPGVEAGTTPDGGTQPNDSGTIETPSEGSEEQPVAEEPVTEQPVTEEPVTETTPESPTDAGANLAPESSEPVNNPDPAGEPADTPTDIGDQSMSTPIADVTAGNFSELRGAQAKLIRKALGGLILVGDMESEVPEKMFTGPNAFVDFKSLGYEPLGWLTKGDGINFTRETEQAEVESFGAQEPTRIDFVKDVTSAAFKCQETNRKVLEIYNGVDLSDVVVDPETGEFDFTAPDLPEAIYRRFIYIAQDGNGEDAKYIFKIMPRAIVSEVQEQAWTSESELAYGLTIKATKDDELGYSVRHVFGGTGFAKLAEAMGFQIGTAEVTP